MLAFLFLAASLAAEPPVTRPPFNPATAKTFDVIARRYQFDFNPSPFVVNQGESVSLRITADDTTHGFFLEHFMEAGISILEKDTAFVNFVADTPGTFTFFCTVVCGDGHPAMSGTLTVIAADSVPPEIASFTPSSGSTSGGTVVAITGFNFQNGAKVRFGDVDALTTIVNSPGSITVFAPARPAGTVLLIVTNPDGQSVTSVSTYTFGPGASPGKRRRGVRGR